MGIKLVSEDDFCDEFGDWDNCDGCKFAIYDDDDRIGCPTLADIQDCEGCPFGQGEDNEHFCNPSPDGSHPCEYEDYKALLIPDLIRLLNKQESNYYRHLDLQEKEEDRKELVKKERKAKTSKLKSVNYDINYDIKKARKRLNKLIKAESSLRNMHDTPSSVNNIFNNSEKKEFVSPYTVEIKETEKLIQSLIEQRKESTKNAKKEIEQKENALLAESIEACIQSINSNGIAKLSDILVLTINNEPVGLSCEVDEILYLTLGKLSDTKPSKKALREKYTRIDFSLDNCNKGLIASFNSIGGTFYTQDLVPYNGAYISRQEKRLGIKNMEITDNSVKDEILKSVIKYK